jgi:hypothetical protein
MDTVRAFGTTTVEQLLASDTPREITDTAEILLPTLRALDNHLDDAINHMNEPSTSFCQSDSTPMI